MRRPSSILVQGVLAGIGVFLVDVWPVLLIWHAGASGAVGDLSELQFLLVGVIFSLILSTLIGWMMTRALIRSAVSPGLGRLDPWGAYALGIGVYNLALTAVPALMYALLLADENKSLRERSWLVYLLWIGGHIVAALIGVLVARVLLGRSLRPSSSEPVSAESPSVVSE